MTFTIFLLGLSIGSFLNVIIARLHMSLQQGTTGVLFSPTRSYCPNCKKTLKVHHIIPLASFCLQKGQCSYCKAPINFQYVCIELLTALIFIISFLCLGLTIQAGVAISFFCFAITLVCIDFKHFLLPDCLTLSFLWVGILFNINGTLTSLSSAVLGAVCGYVSFWSLHWLFKGLRKKDTLGYGDFKLFAALGAWFGWQALPIIALTAGSIGIGYALFQMWIRSATTETPIPFGPPLLLAGSGKLLLFFLFPPAILGH